MMPPRTSSRPIRRRPVVALSLGAAVAGALACQWDRATSPRERTELGVTSAFSFLGGEGAAWLPVGDTATLRASAYTVGWPSSLVYDSYRSEADARRFQWTSSNLGVASIGPTGLVTALSVGVTQLHARPDGVANDFSPTLTVYPAAASIAVERVNGGLEAQVGDLLELALTARDADGRLVAGVPVSVYSSDYALASPIPNIEKTPTPGTQQFGAWRAGVVTLRAVTPHPRPSGRLADSVVVTITDPGVAPDTLPHETSDRVLRASAGRTTLRAGDTTTIRLTLYNRGTAPLRFSGSASCVLGFEVLVGGGNIASPLGERTCSAPVSFTIAPGDSLVRETLWRADDGRVPATPLVPGIYFLWPRGGGDAFLAIGQTLRLRVLP